MLWITPVCDVWAGLKPGLAHPIGGMERRKGAAEDPTTRTGRVLFFTMVAIIVGFLALFLILRPGLG